MTSYGEERRRFPRLDIRIFSISIVVKSFSGEPIEIYPKDIGIGGISFKTDVALKRKDQLKLMIGLPSNPLPERVLAQVVWTHIRDTSSPGGRIWYDIGVEFLDVSGDCRSELENLIEEDIKRRKNQ